MSEPAPDVWRRRVGWHVAFAALALVTVVAAQIDVVDPLRRGLLQGGVVALSLWYAAVGARALTDSAPGPRGLRYLLVAAPITLGLLAAGEAGAIMLFTLYPHLWSMLPARHAMIGTGLVVVAVGVLIAFHLGGMTEGLVTAVAVATVSLVIALLLGGWITTIIRQSEQRRDLAAQLATARSELAAVSREAGVLAERERLARDIHDTLAQGFSSILMLVRAAADPTAEPAEVRRQLALAERVADDNLAESRAMVAVLSPPDLVTDSLPDALGRLASRATAPGAVFELEGEPRRLAAAIEVVVLRAAQEALANVRKHADARTVRLTLGYPEEGVRLTVADDGKGFSPAAAAGGYGLAGMQQRAREAGGELTVRSEAGTGTTLTLWLPA